MKIEQIYFNHSMMFGIESVCVKTNEGEIWFEPGQVEEIIEQYVYENKERLNILKD